jgi:hypothetical protein
MSNAEDQVVVLAWLTDWDIALAEARTTRRVLLIDVWKDP